MVALGPDSTPTRVRTVFSSQANRRPARAVLTASPDRFTPDRYRSTFGEFSVSEELSRRRFMHRASVGAVAAGALTVGGLSAFTLENRESEAEASGPLLEGSGVIAHVLDAKAGTISILVGTRGHHVHQPGDGSAADAARPSSRPGPPPVVAISQGRTMSSHKEAPAISKDPVADSTDVYAFVSPDDPDTVTILANYVPLQDPAGGPNFFEFGAKTVTNNGAPEGEDVLYEIHIDNTGPAPPAITFQFEFTTTILDPNTFLYNTGPITYGSDGYSDTWNRRQTYTVTMVDHQSARRSSYATTTTRSFPARRATWASALLPTTRACPPRPSTRRGAASRSSRASAPKASSSTSARSSTLPTSAPSQRSPDPREGHAWDQRARRQERPLHRPADPHQEPHPQRPSPQRTRRPDGGHRRVHDREPSDRADVLRHHRRDPRQRAPTSRSPASAAHWSTRSSYRWR